MAQEKQEIYENLAQKDAEDLKNFCGSLKEFNTNIDALKNSFENSLMRFLNEKIGIWWKSVTVCLIICLAVNVPGVAIALIFNHHISIEDTAIYCLTAICITCIIGCIIGFIGCIIVYLKCLQYKTNSNGKDS